jgi:hypothetical protein
MFYKAQYLCPFFAFICCLASTNVFAKAYTYSVSGNLPSQIAQYTSPIAITVTITNTSGGSYGLGATINGDQNWVPGSNTCVLTQALANGASCQIQGEFNPQYASKLSQLFLAVKIYPGITITPVVLMQTRVIQGDSISIAPIQQSAPALYSGLQVTNKTTFSQNITITNNTTSNSAEIIPCTYASGLNQCPSTVASGLCPADEGGSMTLAGGQSCNLWYVAQTNISSSGSGTVSLTLTPNLTQAVNDSFNFSYSSSLYAGGTFITTTAGSTVNRIASWSGGEWNLLSPDYYGFDNRVQAMAFDQNGNLYAGGAFTLTCTAPDCSTYVSTPRIALWNGTNWQAMTTSGITTGTSVLALAFDANHNRIYVGGSFTAAGGIPSSYIAYWDTVAQAWGSVTTLGSTVNALAYDNVNDILYAGGNFTGHIAAWNGSTWTTLGTTGLNGNVFAISLGAITSSGRNVMIGGQFTNSSSPRLILWNGSAFVPTGQNPNSSTQVKALATVSTSTGDDTYFGGTFVSVGSGSDATEYAYIGYANYNNNTFTFSPLQTGLNNPSVNAISILSLNTVLIGGSFLRPKPGYIPNVGIQTWIGQK